MTVPALKRFIRSRIVKAVARVVAYVGHRAYRDDFAENASCLAVTIKVLGDEAFIKYVKSSLELLQTWDLTGYRLVLRYITSVVVVEHPMVVGVANGTCFIEENRSGHVPWGPDRFAAYFVREAVRTRLLTGYGLLAFGEVGRQCLKMALKRELLSLKRLRSDASALNELKAEVEMLSIMYT